MSHRFGAITQNGYVVPDMDAAIRHWTQVMGVGPWFDAGVTDFSDVIYRGTPTESKVRIAMANSGDLQIELIEPQDDLPSCYREFLNASGAKGGLHHVSSWPNSEDYDRHLENFVAAGGEILQQGRAGRTRFIYLDTTYDLGAVFEMSDPTPGTRKLFAAIRDAAKTWDGQITFMAPLSHP